MSVAFTSITPGLDWQSAAFLNEIFLAYSERIQATGGLEQELIAPGDNIQFYSPWSTLQAGIDTLATSFVNHVTGPINAGKTDLLMFTLAAWRSAGGLHASGWRRAREWDLAENDWTDPADPMYLHGYMQAGDIIGPWIFDDLQKALSALQWTGVTAGPLQCYAGIVNEGSDENDDCQTARDNCEAEYDADPIAANTFYDVHRDYARAVDGTHNSFYCSRAKARPTLNPVPVIDGCSQDWEVYGIPERDGDLVDPDAMGINAGELGLVASGGPNATATIVGANYIGGTTFPFDLAPAVNCPLPDADSHLDDWRIRDGCWVLKWSFTNQNP